MQRFISSKLFTNSLHRQLLNSTLFSQSSANPIMYDINSPSALLSQQNSEFSQLPNYVHGLNHQLKPLSKQLTLSFNFAKKSKKEAKETNKDKDTKAQAPAEIDLNIAEKHLTQEVSSLVKLLGALQYGKISPTTLESLEVPAYGEKAKLNEVAQIIPKTSQSLQVTIFDESLIENIKKFIENENSNFQVKLEGKNLIVSLVGTKSNEMKIAFKKEINAIGEKGKQNLRKIRHQQIESLLKPLKAVVGKDILHQSEQEIHSLYIDAVKSLESEMKKKENEVN